MPLLAGRSLESGTTRQGSLKSELLGKSYLIFFYFIWFFAPSLSSCLAAISGFEALLGSEVPSRKRLPPFFFF